MNRYIDINEFRIQSNLHLVDILNISILVTQKNNVFDMFFFQCQASGYQIHVLLKSREVLESSYNKDEYFFPKYIEVTNECNGREEPIIIKKNQFFCYKHGNDISTKFQTY